MARTANWVNAILTIVVLMGIGLVGLSVALDTVLVSRIEWLWIAVAGFGIAFTGASLMKN